MHHKDQVVEVYHVNIEEKVDEADHVKTNDETIVPGYLKKEDKIELKEALRSSIKFGDEDIVVGSDVGFNVDRGETRIPREMSWLWTLPFGTL